MLIKENILIRKMCLSVLIAIVACTIGWASSDAAYGYDTFPLYPAYNGENHDCVWQPSSNCPPYVIYYDYFERQTLKINVRDNKLYDSRGDIFDTSRATPSHSGTPAAIFIMDPDGNVFASNDNEVFLFHHSTIAGGQPVAAAGELMVKDGIITTTTNCSGHYRPPAGPVKDQVTESLNDQGYTRPIHFRPCNFSKLKMDLDYKMR